MFDNNWDLINGPVAHQIEVLNRTSQLNVMEALLCFLQYHEKQTGNIGGSLPNAAALRELHRAGTLFLLATPGEYRKIAVALVKEGDVTVYSPPPWEEVEEEVGRFYTDLKLIWQTSTPVEIAAYCLWKINWIHPFANGNGRTARAFAYCCLCLRLGFMPAGSPTVIDLITSTKPEFEAALRHADISFAQSGMGDLSLMKAYVEKLLIQQLSTIPPDEGQSSTAENS